MEHKCIREKEFAVIEKDLKNIFVVLEEHSARMDKQDDRMDKFDEKQDAVNKMATSLAVMAKEMSGISRDVGELKSGFTGLKKDFDNMKEMTTKQQIKALEKELSVWERYKEKVVMIIITAVTTLVLVKIGLS